MVVAQLVERSLLKPKVRGSSPVIGKFIEKTKIKKRPRMAHLKNEKESLAYEVVKRPRVRIPPPGR